ncbi:MAG: hypothetical protein Kow0075_17240 [Salibacteraceae bacterium]
MDAVLQALVYFDLFKHPLREDEVHHFAPYKTLSMEVCKTAIEWLVKNNLAYHIDGYYTLVNDPERIKRRLKGKERADAVIEKAKQCGKTIHRFPFVRGVMISGSLSKGYADDTTDFDFFIVTHHNRLWISRFLLTMWRKTLRKEERKNYCFNYFIADDNLFIPDHNIFTAVELTTLLPIAGITLAEKLVSSNTWAREILPNKAVHLDLSLCEAETKLRPSFTERLLKGTLGDWLDKLFFNIMSTWWRRKYAGYDNFELNFRSGKSVSKQHEKAFQDKVLKRFEERWNEMQSKLKKVKNNAPNTANA